MMSSSKVIKSERLAEHAISSVMYAVLSSETSTVRGTCEDDFIPLLFAPAGEVPEPAPEAQEQFSADPAVSSEEMAVIVEQELQQRLQEVYQRGVDEGRQAAERGLANVFKSLREGIAAITGLREKVLRESEDDLLKLAIMVARKIIQQEISHDPQILANIISAAIGVCTELDKINIRLNPNDYQLVIADRERYLSGTGSDARITLTPDESIVSGGCMVETVTGTIDARIDVQLEEIYRKFMEERGMPGVPSTIEDSQNDDAKS
ncbi:FliH/SctL family protein [Geobacter sp. DSM 9736]|uniref:FliH/SctL family protein n=1 Tax=Geobacter sp. DSM 9736 TaxID=1277350 RepID=UPI000B4FD845|nr:FliH/SctL family protein [Geobacter sp. DSM 9736]